MFERQDSYMKVSKNIRLPKEFKAAVLKGDNAPLEIEQHEIGPLKKGEVWIRMMAAPVNPSDLAMLTGEYPHRKTYPYVPGLEGSGLVVASGGGFMANFVLGKRVACSASDTGDGTWAEYMKVSAGNCIPLISALGDEQAASTIVNPLTALALVETVKEKGSKAFVNTAAAGALGKMLIRLAKIENLMLINIVRREAQVEELKALGAEIVLNSSLESFKEDLSREYKLHKPTVILDAVGGAFSNLLLSKAPDETTLVSYASLTREMIEVHPVPIIRFGKKLEGFHLAFWFSKQSKLKLIKTTRKVQKLIADGTLSSNISNRYSIDDINKAIKHYSENMSEGKSIFIFNQ